MRAADNVARSRGVIRCSGCGQPVEFRKVEFCRPISRPRSVISAAKASSLPDRASATTMQASFPDWTTIPRTRSSILTRFRGGRNMVELPLLIPPFRQAFSLMRNVSSRDNDPSFSRSNKRYSVISLLMEAGAMGTSAFLSRRTSPVATSMTIADLAGVSMAAAGHASPATIDNAEAKTRMGTAVNDCFLIIFQISPG